MRTRAADRYRRGLFIPFPDDWRARRRWTLRRCLADRCRVARRPPSARIARPVRARAATEPVTLITLGPLTNVAAALQLDDGLAADIERVVVMGGAFDVAGNTAGAQPPPARNVAEWNIYADPAAARDVVQAELPLTFVPLDATNRVPLDRVRAASGDRARHRRRTPSAW